MRNTRIAKLMMLPHKLFVVIALLPSAISFVREEPCWSEGGHCLHEIECKGTWKTGLCPSQSANVQCCIPQQDSHCASRRGSCMYTDQVCGGSFESGLCPSQPLNVMCCVPRQERECVGNNGTCIFTNHECSGLFMSNLCPEQPHNVKCCVAVPEQEKPCAERTGRCLYVNQECTGTFVSNLCFNQPSTVKCCIASLIGGRQGRVEACGNYSYASRSEMFSQNATRISLVARPINGGREQHFAVVFYLSNGDERFVHKSKSAAFGKTVVTCIENMSHRYTYIKARQPSKRCNLGRAIALGGPGYDEVHDNSMQAATRIYDEC